jgi:hypothetical protein
MQKRLAEKNDAHKHHLSFMTRAHTAKRAYQTTLPRSATNRVSHLE